MSERVEQFKKEFMPLRKKGVSFEKMAEMFGVSRCTVYANLQAIADMHKVNRSELLYVPHSPHSCSVRHLPANLEAVDINEIGDLFTTLIGTCDKLITKIDTIFEKGEENGNG